VAGLRESLQKEREKAEALAEELGSARREVDTQAALARDAGTEATRTRQTAEGIAAELRQSLQKEREKAEALAKELTTARREVDTQAALARDAGAEAAQARRSAEGSTVELQRSLQQERDRAEALTKELASARRDIDTHVKASSKAATEVKQIKRVAAELRQSLQQERDKAEALARGAEPGRHAADPRLALEPLVNGQTTQVNTTAAMAAMQPPAVVEPRMSSDVVRLLARANALLNQGNIGAARTVLERATEAGSAQASFALAETYDPLVLAKWRTYGTRGDAAKARELYARAQAGGIQEAKDRFDALQQ
jgi:hypothetical protein